MAGIPYSEYVRRNFNPDAHNEGSNAPIALPFDEAAWNRLSLEQQYGNLGGDGVIQSNAGHSIATNGIQGPDGRITVYGPPQLYGHPASQWLNGTPTNNGDGTYTYDPNQINGSALSGYQSRDDDSGIGDSTHFAIAGLSSVLGGAALGAMGGLGEAGAGAGLAGDESAGLSMANPFGGSSLPNSYWGMNAANGTTVGTSGLDAGVGANTTTPWGMIAPGMEGPAAVDSFLVNHGLTSLGGGILSNLAGGNLTGAAGGLLSGAMSNPLQALGMIQAARGLVGSHSSTPSNGSASKSAGGTGLPGTPMNVQRPTWTPNPNTAAQLAQLYGGRFQ